jgi:hypothetical protein
MDFSAWFEAYFGGRWYMSTNSPVEPAIHPTAAELAL